MKYIKLLALALMLLVSYSIVGLVTTESRASLSDEPADQFIAYYNTSEAVQTVVQMSNIDFVNGLALHIQVLDSTCGEVNFVHSLTKGDTDTLTLQANQVLLNGVALPTVLVSPTQGILIVTVVASTSDLTPVDSNDSLMGTAWIQFVDGLDISHQYGAVHRSINANSEFDLIQPEDILSPFNIDDGTNSEFVAAAWTDAYPGGQHFAINGSAATDPLLGLNIFDDNEAPVSCLEFSFECVIAAGVTVALPSFLDIEPPDETFVCDKSVETYGLVDLNDLTVTENLIALQGMFNVPGIAENGGMDYVIDVTAQDDVPPPVEDCDSGADDDGDGLIDCADTEDCADDPACAEGGSGSCDDGVDNDGDGAADCLDEDCDGVGICEFGNEASCNDGADNDGDGLTDCEDTDDCREDDACRPTDGQGGGGGCSVATAATGLGSMASALVLLVPAFGIGIRRIRKRLNK